ncbi:hypothetical protein C5167_043722 [Papaver somniferum]|uniref:Uncharacterized protein n=1 Tax=Papaver somniferum TaxID=3469 RepID=A0A4Y7L863_PAPSO|nr:hypothetical protein C5167_043722 [Papaver somniferum]
MKKMKLMVRNYKKKIEFVSEGVETYRNLTLQCLSEVAALQFRDFYNMNLVGMEFGSNILSLMLEMRWRCSVHVVNMLMYPSMYNVWCKLREAHGLQFEARSRTQLRLEHQYKPFFQILEKIYRFFLLPKVSVFITLLGADFMRMKSFGEVEEFAETLVSKLDRSWKKGICKTYRMQNSQTVEDNGEEHEEHGTKKKRLLMSMLILQMALLLQFFLTMATLMVYIGFAGHRYE